MKIDIAKLNELHQNSVNKIDEVDVTRKELFESIGLVVGGNYWLSREDEVSLCAFERRPVILTALGSAFFKGKPQLTFESISQVETHIIGNNYTLERALQVSEPHFLSALSSMRTNELITYGSHVIVENFLEIDDNIRVELDYNNQEIFVHISGPAFGVRHLDTFNNQWSALQSIAVAQAQNSIFSKLSARGFM